MDQPTSKTKFDAAPKNIQLSKRRRPGALPIVGFREVRKAFAKRFQPEDCVVQEPVPRGESTNMASCHSELVFWRLFVPQKKLCRTTRRSTRQYAYLFNSLL